MVLGSALLDKVRGWRVAGGLAAGSLIPAVPWRGVADIVDGVAGYLDVFALLFIAGLDVADSPTVGVTLAWLLVGWLTYQNAHILYPAAFKTVVDFAGFRVLTALGTLYFGLVVTGPMVGEAVPPQVLPPTFTAIILALCGGIVVIGILFGGYVRRWHPESLYDERSDCTAMFQGPMTEDNDVETLPDRWQSFHRSLETMSIAMWPAIICMFMGLAATVLQLFYPLPEAVFVVGLVAVRVWPEAGPTAGGVPRYEVDRRLVDAISGATQNLKGGFMIMVCLFGMSLSALMVLLYSSIIVGFFAEITTLLGFWAEAPVGRRALAVFTVGTFLLAWLFTGIYSLVHWVRKLERIEPYARYWEGADDEEALDVEETELPTRPPGLLIPAHLPLVGLGVMLAAGELTGSDLIRLGILAVFSSVAVVVMGWGLLWTRQQHEDPQPLAHESRDLLLTVMIPISLILFLSAVDQLMLRLSSGGLIEHLITALIFNFPRFSVNPETGIFSALILALVFYSPEVYDWKSRQEGLWKLLGTSYLTLLILVIIAGVRVSDAGEVSTLAVGILVGLAALNFVLTMLDIYLERIAE